MKKLLLSLIFVVPCVASAFGQVGGGGAVGSDMAAVRTRANCDLSYNQILVMEQNISAALIASVRPFLQTKNITIKPGSDAMPTFPVSNGVDVKLVTNENSALTIEGWNEKGGMYDTHTSYDNEGNISQCSVEFLGLTHEKIVNSTTRYLIGPADLKINVPASIVLTF